MKKHKLYNGLKLNIKFTIVIIVTIAITMAVLAGVLFREQEVNVVSESKAYMEHKTERNKSQIDTCIDSINMSTQFFLADEEMLNVLNAASEGRSLDLDAIVSFKETDVKNLERLVSNNPLLYGVRIYASNDAVSEVMPVLYKNSRMSNLEWAEEGRTGWVFGYNDTAFSALITSHRESLAGLITPITDYKNGVIGTIEAAVNMKTMFPALYEGKDTEYGFFKTDDGLIYYDDAQSDEIAALMETLAAECDSEGQENFVNYIRHDGKKFVVSGVYSKKLGGTLITVLDITANIKKVYNTRNFFVGVMVVVLILLAFIIDFIVKRMLRQFYAILESMEKVRQGNLSVRIKEETSDEMGELGTALNDMLDKIEKLMKENIDREVLVKNSEIRALQNQINAHFIYNVLESIKMMAEIEEKYDISDAITSLGKLLRYSMRWVSGNVTVGQELEYIQDYMALINLRYDYPIHLGVKLDDALLELEIPKMSLQPLVENAILHGIEPLGVENTVYIKGHLEGEDCVIEVSDSGRGMSEEEIAILRKRIESEIDVNGGKGNGIGLKNVNDRIIMAFGKEYGLSMYSKQGLYTKAVVKIPARRNRREAGNNVGGLK
ncbi:MAG: histidine kinase [Lachnospiraceae bacterium]|nr:histidine kinase [Lachnospiraceae bacterium]